MKGRRDPEENGPVGPGSDLVSKVKERERERGEKDVKLIQIFSSSLVETDGV